MSAMALTALFSTLFARISAYRAYRQTYKALSALDDRELYDLGIFRGRIDEIARGAASR